MVPQQEVERARVVVQQVREPGSAEDGSGFDAAAAPAQTLLDQVYGAGRTSVRVTVERSNDVSSFQRRDINTDPSSRVATSSDSSLEQYQSGALAPLPSGRVGCPASQQPDSVTRYCRATERNRYAISEQRSSGTRAAGSVKRMTVAVAVDRSLQPKVNLSDIRAQVARTLGLDASRGDSISVVAVPFAAGSASKPTISGAAKPWDGREGEIAAAAILVGITLAFAGARTRRARS